MRIKLVRKYLTSNMGFSMSHCARHLSFGPCVPESFLPVIRLNTVTCSSPDRLLIHSMGFDAGLGERTT